MGREYERPSIVTSINNMPSKANFALDMGEMIEPIRATALSGITWGFDTDRWLIGGSSFWFEVDANVNVNKAEWFYWSVPRVIGKKIRMLAVVYGVEVGGNAIMHQFKLQFLQPTSNTRFGFGFRLDSDNDVIQYLDSNNTWQTIGTYSSAVSGAWLEFELVVDLTNQEYVSARVNTLESDLTGIAARTSPLSLIGTVIEYKGAVLAGTSKHNFYLDRVIIESVD